VAVVAGALGALVADSLASHAALDVAAAVAGFLLAITSLGYWGQRSILKFTRDLAPRFPLTTDSATTA